MKWLFAFLSLVVVVLAVLAIAPSFFDWNQYKEPALKQIEGITGYNVQIGGDVSLALLPSPRVYLEDVRVADPADASGEKTLAAFKKLDVRVELSPLFHGKVGVNTVYLDTPQISLSKNAEGRFNFMTPKVEAMMSAKQAVDGANKGQAGRKFSLSFDGVSINDGSFLYREPGQKAPLVLSKINLDVEADSLQGPFEVEGGVDYNGTPVSFTAKTGKIDQALQSTSLNLKGQMRGVAVRYAGVVSFGDAPEVQGEAAVQIADLAALMKEGDAPLKGGVSISGLLSANAEKAALKNADIEIAGKRLSGEIAAAMEPISVQGTFVGQEIIDLDALIGGQKKSASGQGGFDPLSLGGMLPKTLEIPELGDVKLSLRAPGVIFNGQVLKEVQFNLQNTEKSFAAQADIGEMPGQGRAQLSGALSFAEKSKSAKTGAVIYSGPAAAFELKGETQNLPVTVQAFTGLANLPLVKDAKRGVFEFAGKVRPSSVSLDKGVINMDSAAFSVSGAFKGQNDSVRSLLSAKVVADRLDFDSIMGGSSEPKTGDPLQPLKTLALPYDADIDLRVNDATLAGHEIKGFVVEAALRPNTLKITKAGADQFVGSSVNVSGAIADLKNMAGLDLSAAVDTPDPYKLAGAFKMDTSAWPKNLGTTKANVKASGNVSVLDVKLSVQAMGGEVGASGTVANPITSPAISGLAVNVKHPNMAKMLANFAPGAPDYASLAKPMSFKADVAMEGKVTSLSAINADLAGASVNGNIRIDGSGAKPSLSGTLRIGDLVLKSGKSGSSTEQKSVSGSSAGGGKWSSAPMDTGWLHAMNANLDVAANSIIYETWNLSKPALKLTIQDGVMNIANLQSGLYDGQIAANGTVSSSSPSAPMAVKIASQIENINMGALAKALAGSGRIQAEGDVSLDFDVAGQGASQAALVSSLSGAANLSGNKVVMKGFDLAGLAGALMESSKPLPRVQEILRSSTSSGQTAFDTVEGRYAISNGVVNITSMQMTGPEATIVSKGNVSLPRWFIDTTHTITLANVSNEVTPFDVVIRGSLDNPGNTFGSGLFDTFVRQRLQQKVVEELPDLLGEDVTSKLQKFGILPQQKQPAPVPETEPASGIEGVQPAPVQEQPQVAPKSDEEKAQEALQGLLKGLLQ
ncbi:MAG: AsmA family protein [Rhodospirillales bacterium]|nr:AsmA family protein [Rhodospirillales bacterium]